MSMRILDPTINPEHAEAALAARVADLDGKAIGLLANGKVNADQLLDLVREGLAARYRLGPVVTLRKPGASRIAEEAMLATLARDCDVVVTAIGD